MSKLTKAKNKLNNEGILGLIKYILKYFYLKLRLPFLAISTIFQLKALKPNQDIDCLLNFAFEVGDGVINPLQIRSEITGLLELVKDKKPKIVMEIGTASGGTLFLLTQMSDDNAQIMSLDLPRGEFGGGYPWWKIPIFKSFAHGKQKVALVRGDSHSSAMLEKIIKELNSQKIDFLFIDGDHTYEGVKQDFEMYSPLVAKDGMIGFHDIAPHPVEKNTQVDILWNELKKKYEHKEFVDNWNQGCAGIGVIFNK